MKLDFDNFPAMKTLAADVRQKAVEFAESLGARGPRPTTVLGTAVTLAREWKSGRLPTRPISAPFLVQPRAGRWVIKRSTDEKPSHTFMRMDDAVRRAQQLAREVGAACFVFGPGGTLIERFEARAIAEMKLPKEPVVEALEARETVGEPPAEASPVVVANEATVARETMTVVEAEKGSLEVPAEVATETIEAPVAAAEAQHVTQVTKTLDAASVAEVAGTLDAGSVAEVAGTLEATSVAEVAESARNAAPVRVKKAQGKWAVVVDEVIEMLPTRAKAIKRAYELGHKLGRQVLS
jgi:hypothetical protein